MDEKTPLLRSSEALNREAVALLHAIGETEHTRVLSAKDPVAPQNIVRYSFRERTYKLDASVEQCALHFEMEGNLMHRDRLRRRQRDLASASRAVRRPGCRRSKTPAEPARWETHQTAVPTGPPAALASHGSVHLPCSMRARSACGSASRACSCAGRNCSA